MSNSLSEINNSKYPIKIGKHVDIDTRRVFEGTRTAPRDYSILYETATKLLK